MSKRSKTASTQEISIELAESAQDALVEVLQQTQWVELPFRDAVMHLEQECDRFFDSEYPEGFFFFAAQYLIQTTDEKRFSSPVVELLGVLFAWETQIRDFGKEWFKERTDHLLALMRALPPEQDKTLLALLHALDPGAHKIMLQFASQAARKAADAKHDKPGGSRELRDKIRAVWASGKYSSREICADEEWEELGFGSRKAARNALLNTPPPLCAERVPAAPSGNSSEEI